ncbi:hypothetical protein CFIO01_00265 [Colletotrichum fioriniae PJ7]|uniref:Uncharacterized protein n=1 Tax=Colletotrichum fioriniae PJ7 TaxID=1445577 RepID=A0A010QNI6_9PEZI|nr:hypothetical protein CFIO01_00265 [Colletotrichum fioriniae PJ7]
MSSYDPETMDLWVPGTEVKGSGNLTWEQLDFNRNCTNWGQWLAAMLQPDPWDPKSTRGMSVQLSMSLYSTAMPKGYETTYSEVSYWFAYNMYHTPYPENSSDPSYYLFSTRFNETVLWGPKEHCEAEFCKAVGYTGSQDLCGIGVVVSYYLEAILATMYLIAFTIHQVRRHFNKNLWEKTRPKQKQRLSGRILDSFRGSLDMFLSGSMLIAVAMLGASVYSAATNFKERSEVNPDLPSADAIYEQALALIASNYSVFPVMLLYALAKHDGHRKWLHRSVLALLWGLSVTVVYLAPRAEIDYKERKSGHRNFECDQRGSQYWPVVKATQFLVIALPMIWLLLTLFVTTGFKIPGMIDKPWVQRWRSCWRMLVAWINLLVMWGILGYFTHFRQKIINAADGIDKNDKWTFGQVLALAAWVPVIAELLYILIFGLEEGLSGHMPADYHATHVTQPDQNMGVPLLDRGSMYDMKHASTMSAMSVSTTLSSPATPGQVQTPMWQQNSGYQHSPVYQPVNMQQPHVQHHQSWDGYYHTGW